MTKYKKLERNDIFDVIKALNLVPKRNGKKFAIERGFACDDYTGKLVVYSDYGCSAFRRYFNKCGIKGLHFEGAYLAQTTGNEWHIEFCIHIGG